MKLEQLKQVLHSTARAHDVPALEQGQRLAAVLMLLAPGRDGHDLVFTRRSKSLSNNAGQISFPGGTLEKQDKDLLQTALRESEEEIGLVTEQVSILGTLDWLSMPSGFVVLPVVGSLQESQEFKAAPDEVTEIFALPLRSLLDNSLYRQDSYTRNNIKRNFYYIDINGYYIWGATAAMLRSLALRLAG